MFKSVIAPFINPYMVLSTPVSNISIPVKKGLEKAPSTMIWFKFSSISALLSGSFESSAYGSLVGLKVILTYLGILFKFLSPCWTWIPYVKSGLSIFDKLTDGIPEELVLSSGVK